MCLPNPPAALCPQSQCGQARAWPSSVSSYAGRAGQQPVTSSRGSCWTCHTALEPVVFAHFGVWTWTPKCRSFAPNLTCGRNQPPGGLWCRQARTIPSLPCEGRQPDSTCLCVQAAWPVVCLQDSTKPRQTLCIFGVSRMWTRTMVSVLLVSAGYARTGKPSTRLCKRVHRSGVRGLQGLVSVFESADNPGPTLHSPVEEGAMILSEGHWAYCLPLIQSGCKQALHSPEEADFKLAFLPQMVFWVREPVRISSIFFFRYWYETLDT